MDRFRQMGLARGTGVSDDSRPKEIPDEQLLQRHLQGDSQALAALIHRYRRELFNFLFRFLGDAAMAEDVFQETFLQLHASGATFDMSRRLKPWLFTIAANKARDAMRGRSRRAAMPLDASLGGPEGEEATYAGLMPGNIPPPEETLSNLETRLAVQKVVENMPETLRTVLILGHFQEMSYKDIAEVLNIPLGTVKSRLHAAVKYFAERWKAVAEHKKHG